MCNIVHIGLGKTATTTLQRYVFPRLAKAVGLTWNDREIRLLLTQSMRLEPDAAERRFLQERLAQARHMISCEGMVGWDPARWEQAADRNLDWFGSDAWILIGVREPVDWMTSVYQQQIH